MMMRNRKGGMKKVDDYIELRLSGKEDYSQCVSKGYLLMLMRIVNKLAYFDSTGQKY